MDDGGQGIGVQGEVSVFCINVYSSTDYSYLLGSYFGCFSNSSVTGKNKPIYFPIRSLHSIETPNKTYKIFSLAVRPADTI